MKHKKKKNKFSIKWSLVWILIHSVSLFLLGMVLDYLNLQNGFVQLLIIGFGVTIFARIAKIFTAKEQFIADKWFIFWSLINSITVWISFILLNVLNISNYLVSILLTAFGLVFVAYFVRRFKITKTTLWISVIIILLLLFFTQSSNQQDLVYSKSSNIDMSAGGILNSVKNIFSSEALSDCPQLDYPMTRAGSGSYKPYILDVKEHDGWTIRGYKLPIIYCYKGNEKGENPNYWYCGDLDVRWGENADYGIMEKTIINEDGTIGETIRISFSNIYDSDMNFIKTVCGKDPDKIIEEGFKDTIKEIDDLFTLS